jgi:hypothetical protein
VNQEKKEMQNQVSKAQRWGGSDSEFKYVHLLNAKKGTECSGGHPGDAQN